MLADALGTDSSGNCLWSELSEVLLLSRAGHDVTVVARGKRLEQLERDQAIVSTSGERAAVRVSSALDATA
jgi:ketopantoate reductase